MEEISFGNTGGDDVRNKVRFGWSSEAMVGRVGDNFLYLYLGDATQLNAPIKSLEVAYAEYRLRQPRRGSTRVLGVLWRMRGAQCPQISTQKH